MPATGPYKVKLFYGFSLSLLHLYFSNKKVKDKYFRGKNHSLILIIIGT